MFLTCIFLLLLLSKEAQSQKNLAVNTNNYGPYTLVLNDVSLCKGPKNQNATSITAAFEKINNKFTGIANMNVTYSSETHIEDIRISVYNDTAQTKKLLWNYKLKEPCEHFAIAAILKELLKTHKCNVKKGTYRCYFDLRDVVNSYLGTSFFYGAYLFKVITSAKKRNIFCLILKAVFNKTHS
ncbi:hypothetical protein K1T71_008608 [Dendrolimus kikuchii]|uniref:Uncharacterized protein n=1 Tax=Dendrolimus kikuchii TaxID=765133 RepID=A0ACC1CVF6_9NEOP|nr:hypothetical protein K1T71_008608 [Dendrolimus kikuchii]